MSSDAAMWTCERCGRAFASRNQTHTCAPLGRIDDHFVGKAPAIRATFDAVLAVVEEMGPVAVLPEKSRIALRARMSFAAFVARREWLDGHVVLASRFDHPRFRTITTYSPRNIVHTFRLHGPADVDDTVRSWLVAAYDVGTQSHLRG